MQLIEAALAFAITMLALSLVVSSFVEIIHRIFSMREAGLKYVLGQMFDQVLAKYVEPAIKRTVETDATIVAAARNEKIRELLTSARTGFVERMSANRAPMGVTPKATPTDPAEQVASNPKRAFGLWSGRDLASLTPGEFMERLGSMDVGQAIVEVSAAARGAVQNAGAAAADAVDVALKDVAQKFEAFGKEASVYFEGRARLLSVVVAIALAFAAHVDAVDLFRTYLRDPNARAKVIEQSAAVTAQHKAAVEAMKALQEIDPTEALTTEEVKKQIDALRNDWKEAVAKANSTVKQYADLGVPLGWNDDRIKVAKMLPLVWACTKLSDGDTERFGTWWQTCRSDEEDSMTKQQVVELQQSGAKLNYTKHRNIWLQAPTVASVWFYLFLGGLLVGLGAPFWYDAVTGLTNIRNAARGTSADAQTRAAVVTAAAATTQPATPVDAFKVSAKVSNAAQL
jgi:hypothetical protein